MQTILTTLRSAVRPLTTVCVLCTVWVCIGDPGPAAAQQGATGGEWRGYGGEPGATKYSPLDQIGPENVQNLRVAWRWRSVDYDLVDEDPDLRFNNTLLATPLMVGGRLFMSTNLGQAAAIDPATGRDGLGLPRPRGWRRPAARRIDAGRRLLARCSA